MYMSRMRVRAQPNRTKHMLSMRRLVSVTVVSVMRRQGIKEIRRSSRHSMPSRGADRKHSVTLMQARSVTMYRPYDSRMAGGHFIPGLSENCSRGWGSWSEGTLGDQAKPRLWRKAEIAVVDGTQRGDPALERIINLVFQPWRHPCSRIRLQSSAGSSFCGQWSWNWVAQWQEHGRGSRAGGVKEEEHHLGAQQERDTIIVAAATATGEQQQHLCKLNSSWRSAMRGWERRGFLLLAPSFSLWAPPQGTRASTPISQSCSHNRPTKRTARWRHHHCHQAEREGNHQKRKQGQPCRHLCHQAERKGTLQRRSQGRKQETRGRSLWKFTHHLGGQLLRASLRNHGGRDGKVWKKDRAGHASWKKRIHVRRLRHILQAFVRHQPISRNEAMPGNPILHVDYVEFMWSQISLASSHNLQPSSVSRPGVGNHESS